MDSRPAGCSRNPMTFRTEAAAVVVDYKTDMKINSSSTAGRVNEQHLLRHEERRYGSAGWPEWTLLFKA